MVPFILKQYTVTNTIWHFYFKLSVFHDDDDEENDDDDDNDHYDNDDDDDDDNSWQWWQWYLWWNWCTVLKHRAPLIHLGLFPNSSWPLYGKCSIKKALTADRSPFYAVNANALGSDLAYLVGNDESPIWYGRKHSIHKVTQQK